MRMDTNTATRIVHRFNEYGDPTRPAMRVQVVTPSGAIVLVDVSTAGGTFTADVAGEAGALAIAAAQEDAR